MLPVYKTKDDILLKDRTSKSIDLIILQINGNEKKLNNNDKKLNDNEEKLNNN